MELQFPRISHFMTLRLRGGPRGGPQISLTPKIILMCTKWPNLNLETILGSIAHCLVPLLTSEDSRERLRPPPPPTPPPPNGLCSHFIGWCSYFTQVRTIVKLNFHYKATLFKKCQEKILFLGRSESWF